MFLLGISSASEGDWLNTERLLSETKKINPMLKITLSFDLIGQNNSKSGILVL